MLSTAVTTPFDDSLALREDPLQGEPLCAHCGDYCSSDSIHEGDLLFCCSGCRTVYKLLQEHNLCEYYDRSENAGVSMQREAMSYDQYDILDDSTIAEEMLSYKSESRNRVTWTVPTLHCASCVWLLEQLSRLDGGIVSSTVDIMRKSVTIDYNPSLTTLRNVAGLLTSIGYSPLLRLEKTDIGHSGTRKLYARIGVAGFAMVNTMLVAVAQYLAGSEGIEPVLRNTFNVVAIALSIPVLLYSASPWFVAAFAALRQRKISLDVPVALGILALFIRSAVEVIGGLGEGYFDSFNALIFLLLLGRLFQQKAFDTLSFDRNYRSFFPLSVRVFRDDEAIILPIEEITPGDTLIVRNEEVIPCDSTLGCDTAYIDYSFVTGESLPVESIKGQTVYAGGKIVGRAATLVAKKEVSHSELASMWDRTWKRTSRTTFLTISDTFGRWFTLSALIIALVGAALWLPDWQMAFNVLTAVLIIACPCALTLSAPITLGTAMGVLGKLGIYLKNIGTLLELERVTAVLFDKTGTLTKSDNQLVHYGKPLTQESLIALKSIAFHSSHPVSRMLTGNREWLPVSRVFEFVGRGISGTVQGKRVAIGSEEFISSQLTNPLEEQSIELTSLRDTPHAAAHLAIDGHYLGFFTYRSELRKNVGSMVATLESAGKKIGVISGDDPHDRELLSPLFGNDNLTFNCRPEDKIEKIEQLQAANHIVLMVGDGLNDAGAMSTADVAIAVTEDTATLVPACDVIVRASSIHGLASLLQYSVRVKRLIIGCFIISLLYNALGLSLAIMGLLSPLVAAILMPVSSLTIIAISAFGARLSCGDLRRSLDVEDPD